MCTNLPYGPPTGPIFVGGRYGLAAPSLGVDSGVAAYSFMAGSAWNGMTCCGSGDQIYFLVIMSPAGRARVRPCWAELSWASAVAVASEPTRSGALFAAMPAEAAGIARLGPANRSLCARSRSPAAENCCLDGYLRSHLCGVLPGRGSTRSCRGGDSGHLAGPVIRVSSRQWGPPELSTKGGPGPQVPADRGDRGF